MKLMESARIGELPKGKVGPLAQLVEQRTFNPWVDGSSPSGPTFDLLVHDCFRSLASSVKLSSDCHKLGLLRHVCRLPYLVLLIDLQGFGTWLAIYFLVP